MTPAPGPAGSARLRWQCRRGILEVDLLLQRFLDEGLERLPAARLAAFERLLTVPDPLLLTWLMGQARPTDPELADVVDLVRQPPGS